MAWKPEKITLLSKKLVFPQRMDTTINMYSQELPFHCIPQQTDRTGRSKLGSFIASYLISGTLAKYQAVTHFILCFSLLSNFCPFTGGTHRFYELSAFLLIVIGYLACSCNGGEQRQHLSQMRTGDWSAQPSGWAEGWSEEVEEYQRVWERLTGGPTTWEKGNRLRPQVKRRIPSPLVPGGWWPQRRGGMETGSKQIHSWPPLPSQLLLQNRYGVLQEELVVKEEDRQTAPKVLSQSDRPFSNVITSSTRKKRRVLVVGESLLKATEALICSVDSHHSEVYSLEPRLGISSGHSPAWCTQQTTTHCWSSRQVGRKQRITELLGLEKTFKIIKSNLKVTETWWARSHDWNVAMDGYTLLSKDRRARRGGGGALYVREQLECTECYPGADEEWTEYLWVRIKGQTGMGDTVVGVYYMPPDQDEELDEAFYRELIAASQLQALVITGDFNYPDIS